MRFLYALAFSVVGVGLCPHGCFGATSDGSFSSKGTQIAYKVAGEGPPVVLLHSGTSSTELDWIESGILERLSRRFRVIAPDARGHGQSGKPHSPADYGVQMVHDVARLMDHLGVEDAHIVGSSMGGFIALKFAALHPQRVRSLLTIGAGWLNADWDRINAEWSRWAEQLESGSTDVGDNDPLAIAAVLRGANGWLVDEAALRAVRMPFLAIMGENDSFRPLLDALKGLIPQLEIELLAGRDHNTAEGDTNFIPLVERFLVAQ